jgi:hypothetical protein
LAVFIFNYLFLLVIIAVVMPPIVAVAAVIAD